jgi:hypothetical protein
MKLSRQKSGTANRKLKKLGTDPSQAFRTPTRRGRREPLSLLRDPFCFGSGRGKICHENEQQQSTDHQTRQRGPKDMARAMFSNASQRHDGRDESEEHQAEGEQFHDNDCAGPATKGQQHKDQNTTQPTGLRGAL